MGTGGQGLAKCERLNGAAISRLFESGAAARSRFFIVRCLANGLGVSRMAPVVGKKCGNACDRNRLKRIVRALYRTNKAQLPAGYDWLLIPRPGLGDATMPDRTKALLQGVARACEEAARLPAPASVPAAAPVAPAGTGGDLDG